VNEFATVRNLILSALCIDAFGDGDGMQLETTSESITFASPNLEA
jgi:hypothetical protein